MARVRALWPAVHRLRAAERVADLGLVAGPADEPPQVGDVRGWVEEWRVRGSDLLSKARGMLASGVKSLVERARYIAEQVRAGAAEIDRFLRTSADESLQDLRAVARGLGEEAGKIVSAAAAGVMGEAGGLLLAGIVLYTLSRK